MPPNADLFEALAAKVVGQEAALKAILPWVRMYQAGLSPEGRPAGVFLLLGPTGTGKTRTVESLADILHGSEKNVLRIDCGEFQMEHEVAKLIGAPPGYLGHKETTPILTQQRVNAAASERCDLSLVLFDEIEKAATSMQRLLLGVLDKATLRLGDNNIVNFERSLIFFTSNVGAQRMMRAAAGGYGLECGLPADPEALRRRMRSIASSAVRQRFSPEFLNRVDATITYHPLEYDSLERILDIQIQDLQRHVNSRLGSRSFRIEVPQDGRRFLLEKGTCVEFGARELRRTLHRHITQPLAALVADGQVQPGAVIRAEPSDDHQSLALLIMD